MGGSEPGAARPPARRAWPPTRRPAAPPADPPAVTRRAFPLWPEVTAGLAGAMASLPLNLAHGAIAFAPLGAEGVVAGAAAAVVTGGLGGLVLGLLASSRPLIGGPSAPVSLSVAGVLGAGLAAGAIPSGAAGIGTAILISALLTVAAGLVLAGLAVLRLGRAATLIPYPVLSGFLNGTAVLLVLTQIGPLLGHPLGDRPAPEAARPLATLVALAAALAMVLPAPGPLGRIPGVMRALLVGLALDAGLRLAGLDALLGPLLGAPPTIHQHGDDMLAGLHAFQAVDLLPLLPMLALAAATIAALAAIETLGTSAALRELGQPRADIDRDLRALAAANVATGLGGGIGVCGSLSATRASHAAGGRTRVAAAVRGVALLLVLAALGPAVALVPQAALAGIVLGTAWLLADAGTLRPLRVASGRGVSDALVMLAVAAIAVGWSLAAAVGIGILLAVLAFTASMSRGVVRRAWRNPGGRSRTRRPARAEAILLAAGGRIEVLELEGALFFGSADDVALKVEAAAATGAGWIILDLARVTRLDLSGGRQLLRLLRQPPGQGAQVLLAGLRPGHPAQEDLAALALLPALPPGTVFETLEAAIESAEDRILAEQAAGPADAPTDPHGFLVQLGVAPDIATRLLAQMREVRFPAGQAVIRRGDPPDALYVMVSGAAEITIPRPDIGTLRVATITPGAIFGEMAVLTGAPRSADILARTPLACLALDAAALARLEREDPPAAAALLRAIARQIDSNLRMANTTIASLQR